MLDGARDLDVVPPLRLDRIAAGECIAEQPPAHYRARWCRAAEIAAFVFAVLVVICWIVATP